MSKMSPENSNPSIPTCVLHPGTQITVVGPGVFACPECWKECDGDGGDVAYESVWMANWRWIAGVAFIVAAAVVTGVLMVAFPQAAFWLVLGFLVIGGIAGVLRARKRGDSGE